MRIRFKSMIFSLPVKDSKKQQKLEKNEQNFISYFIIYRQILYQSTIHEQNTNLTRSYKKDSLTKLCVAIQTKSDDISIYMYNIH